MKQGTTNLQGEVVRLRKYRIEDATTLYEKLGCDPEMMRFTEWNPYSSFDATKAFLTDIINRYGKDTADYSWLIEADGTAVGTIGAYDFDEKENAIEIGYSVFREHWGKGYASAALQLACAYLMDEEGIGLLKTWSAVENLGSKRVLEKTGFVQTEILESGIDVNDNKYDQAFFEKRS